LTPLIDEHMAVNGTLEMSRFEGGYFDEYGNPHYYLTDYQGNVVRVIDETGIGTQPMDYYPYGEPWQEWDWALADTYPTFNKNRFLYGGKERITQFGLGLYNFEARMYRAPLGRFSTPDKKAIDTPWLSPFAYCACNPVNAIDPTGNSTMVKRADNGKYEVFGGDLNDKDRNIYVYSQDKDGNYTVKGESIGVTTSMTSFYNSDSGQWGGTIDPGDTSGQEFLADMMNNPPTLDDYIANAGNNKLYDFKVTNGLSEFVQREDYYRGMPVDVDKNGQTVYTSARDVGNIAAGYMAAINGLPWKVARFGFDGYQSYTSKAFKREGISTRNAEHYGWEIGWNKTTSFRKIGNLFNSAKSFIIKVLN
jgi:RHS repeat-associated protein